MNKQLKKALDDFKDQKRKERKDILIDNIMTGGNKNYWAWIGDLASFIWERAYEQGKKDVLPQFVKDVKRNSKINCKIQANEIFEKIEKLNLDWDSPNKMIHSHTVLLDFSNYRRLKKKFVKE